MAVQLWQMYRRHEIEQGQGQAAMELFANIQPNQVAASTYEQLRLVRAELARLTGQYDWVERDLQAVAWSQPTLQYQAQRLLGDTADVQDYWDVALRHYDEGLRTVQHLLMQSALFRKSRAWSLANLSQLDQALIESQRALCEIEYFYACLLDDNGDLDAAWTYAQRVLERATALQFRENLVNVHDLLGLIAAKRGDFSTAIPTVMRPNRFASRLAGRVHWPICW
ncbi:MAG: hypothetical protein HC837_16215 [Chloroflexaceae bacterium]|nr:hypothetical protein [Chloroflexaceae bacterium]